MAQSPVVLAGSNIRRAGDRFFSSTVVKAYRESGKWCGSPFAGEDEDEVQSGQWLFTLCQSLLKHCSVFHLLASLSKMHENCVLCEGFPPTGRIYVPV